MVCTKYPHYAALALAVFVAISLFYFGFDAITGFISGVPSDSVGEQAIPEEISEQQSPAGDELPTDGTDTPDTKDSGEEETPASGQGEEKPRIIYAGSGGSAYTAVLEPESDKIIVLNNRELELSGRARITFREDIDFSSLDLSRVFIGNNIISIDSANAPLLNKPATIFMQRLDYTKTPKVLYSRYFTIDKAEITEECPDYICSNINYDSATGTLRFDVAHFSSFTTDQSILELYETIDPLRPQIDIALKAVEPKLITVTKHDVKIKSGDLIVDLNSQKTFTNVPKGDSAYLNSINVEVEAIYEPNKDPMGQFLDKLKQINLYKEPDYIVLYMLISDIEPGNVLLITEDGPRLANYYKYGIDGAYLLKILINKQEVITPPVPNPQPIPSPVQVSYNYNARFEISFKTSPNFTNGYVRTFVFPELIGVYQDINNLIISRVDSLARQTVAGILIKEVVKYINPKIMVLLSIYDILKNIISILYHTIPPFIGLQNFFLDVKDVENNERHVILKVSEQNPFDNTDGILHFPGEPFGAALSGFSWYTKLKVKNLAELNVTLQWSYPVEDLDLFVECCEPDFLNSYHVDSKYPPEKMTINNPQNGTWMITVKRKQPFVSSYSLHPNVFTIKTSFKPKVGGIDFTSFGLNSISTCSDLSKLSFVIKGKEGTENIISLQDAKDLSMKYFRTALAIPNYKQWISLPIGGVDVDSVFAQTELAKIMLEQDVVLKKTQFPLSCSANVWEDMNAYWEQLLMESPYYSELQAAGFSRYPNWIFRGMIIPDKVDVEADGCTVFVKNFTVGAEMSSLEYAPWLDFSGFNFRQEIASDLNNRLLSWNQRFHQLLNDRVVPLLKKAINENPEFEPIRRIYPAVALAHWYKTLDRSKVFLADYIDSQDISGLEASVPFDANYWSQQSKQILDFRDVKPYCYGYGGVAFWALSTEAIGAVTQQTQDMINEAVFSGNIPEINGERFSGGFLESGRPEIMIESLIVHAPESETNENVPIKLVVKNEGTKPAPAFKVYVYDEFESTVGTKANYFIALETVSGLNPDEAAELNIPWNTRDFIGKHTIRIVADYGNAVKESNEFNNIDNVPVNVIRGEPEAEIFFPETGAGYFYGDTIVLFGFAFDSRDGILSNDSLEWSSSIDGIIGRGGILVLNNTSVGNHIISFTATDSDGKKAVAQIGIIVKKPVPSVIIEEPVFGNVFLKPYDNVTLKGHATDAKDGNISSENLYWYSSIDDLLGIGNEVSISSADLSTGLHMLELKARNSYGIEGNASSYFIVTPAQSATPIETFSDNSESVDILGNKEAIDQTVYVDVKRNSVISSATLKISADSGICEASSGYVMLGDREELRPENTAIEAWVKTTSDATMSVFTTGRIQWGSGPGATHYGIALIISEGYPDVEIGIGRGDDMNPFVRGTNKINDGKWHLLQASYIKLGEGIYLLSLYVDGILQGTSMGDGPIIYDANSVYRTSTIGARYYGPVDLLFYGIIDEVKILEGSTGSIRGEWKLDETGGSVAFDSGPSQINGEVIGDSLVVKGIQGNARRFGTSLCGVINSSMDAGNDSVIDWKHEDDFSGSEVIEFTRPLQLFIDNPLSCSRESDYCTVPIGFKADSGGTLTVSDIMISYLDADTKPPAILVAVVSPNPVETGEEERLTAYIYENDRLEEVKATAEGKEYNMTFNHSTELYDVYYVDFMAGLPGTKTAEVIAKDATGLVSTATADYTVTSRIPDLSVDANDIFSTPEILSELTEGRINVIVRNLGRQDADNVLVEFYAGGSAIASERMNIPAENEQFVSFVVMLSYGMHEIKIIIDGENEIVEANENNNEASVEIEVLDFTGPEAPVLTTSPNEWTSTGIFDVSWNPLQDSSGIARYEYSVDAEDWVDNGLGTFFTTEELPEGLHTARVRGIDGAGNIGREGIAELKVDKSPPNTPVVTERNLLQGFWNSRNEALFVWNDPGDFGSGAQRFIASVDSGEEIDLGYVLEYSAIFESGEHSFKVKAVDALGQESAWSNEVIVKIDTEPPQLPVISSSTHPEEITWYKSNMPVLSWITPEDMSGIWGYYYWIDNQFDTVPGPESLSLFTTSQEIEITHLPLISFGNEEIPEGVPDGSWYFHMAPVDNAGNKAPDAAHYRINIDRTPPSTTDNSDSGWHNGDYVLNLNPLDMMSGVAATYYEINGEPNEDSPQGIEITFLNTGEYVVKYFSKDSAGNNEETKTAEVLIDATPPLIHVNSPVEEIASPFEPLLINFTTSDEHSGLREVHAFLDGSEVFSGDLVDLPDEFGFHELTIRAIDNAGNAAEYAFRFSTGIILEGEEEFRITPEVLKVNPGIIMAHINFPEPFAGSEILEATLDGAPHDQIVGGGVKFRRQTVEEYQHSIGQELDVHFELIGIMVYNGKKIYFIGEDDITEVKND